MNIAHLTDIHMNDFMSQECNRNPQHNIVSILKDIKKRNIEKVIFTGDFGNYSSFQWLIDTADIYNFEYYYTLGNHDDVNIYKQRTDLKIDSKDDGLYYSLTLNDDLYLFLDSSSSSIHDPQRAWITDVLHHSSYNRVVVFVHHPLLDCGFTTMDRLYPLKNRSDIVPIFNCIHSPVYIFCGHYHSNHEIKVNNIVQYVTPSVLVQVKKYSEKIEIDNFTSYYRVITIGEQITTELICFPNE